MGNCIDSSTIQKSISYLLFKCGLLGRDWDRVYSLKLFIKRAYVTITMFPTGSSSCSLEERFTNSKHPTAKSKLATAEGAFAGFRIRGYEPLYAWAFEALSWQL